MTNKYMYFIANWKMYGVLKTLNSLNRVISFSKKNMKSKIKLIYCPPSTLISMLSKKLKNSSIEIGAQNCHESQKYASAVNKKEHVNCKTGKALKKFCEKFFKSVFLFSMNDEIVHTGFSPMSQYIICICVFKKDN